MFDCSESSTAGLDGPAGTAQTGSGAPPSNTAPPNCNQGMEGRDPRLLRTSIDSLYLSYGGSLAVAWAARLDELRSRAKNEENEVQRTAQVKICDHLFEVAAKGRGKYKYVLKDNWFDISIASASAKSMPLAYVQISSEVITCLGLDAALDGLRPVIGTLGRIDGQPKVSRADLCVDFVTRTDFSAIRREAWVTRAERYSVHHVGLQFSGISIGVGGAISARLYDKTLELKQSHKEYLRGLWAACGWTDSEDVWRLEFQYRRNFLRTVQILTLDDFLNAIPSLWHYSIDEWLKLTIPNPGDKTSARWPIHPVWRGLSHAPWSNVDSPALYPVRRSRVPRDDYLFRNGVGAITSFMAREGITDVSEGIGAYLAAMDAYHQEHGQGARAYLQGKVRDKGRRFNTIDNRRPELGQVAADAEAYRKAKDGE